MKIKGIDISRHQGKTTVDTFKKAKTNSSIEFVILRIGYTGYKSLAPTIDEQFENNYTNATAAGLPVGVYYYSLATTKAEAEKEAKFILEKIKGKEITYPVYIDVEDSKYRQYKKSKSALADVCNAFCKVINNAGYTAGVYAGLYWLNNKIGKITEEHTQWVAQYASKCTYKGDYDMWQYTSKGKISGFSGNIDVSYLYKDLVNNLTKQTTIATETSAKTGYTGTFPTLPSRGYFKRGDAGTQVKYVQRFLNWYGSYKLSVDGSFGQKTEKAVKKYQSSLGLKADGCFGKASLAKAKSIKK